MFLYAVKMPKKLDYNLIDEYLALQFLEKTDRNMSQPHHRDSHKNNVLVLVNVSATLIIGASFPKNTKKVLAVLIWQ